MAEDYTPLTWFEWLNACVDDVQELFLIGFCGRVLIATVLSNDQPTRNIPTLRAEFPSSSSTTCSSGGVCDPFAFWRVETTVEGCALHFPGSEYQKGDIMADMSITVLNNLTFNPKL